MTKHPKYSLAAAVIAIVAAGSAPAEAKVVGSYKTHNDMTGFFPPSFSQVWSMNWNQAYVTCRTRYRGVKSVELHMDKPKLLSGSVRNPNKKWRVVQTWRCRDTK